MQLTVSLQITQRYKFITYKYQYIKFMSCEFKSSRALRIPRCAHPSVLSGTYSLITTICSDDVRTNTSLPSIPVYSSLRCPCHPTPPDFHIPYISCYHPQQNPLYHQALVCFLHLLSLMGLSLLRILFPLQLS